MVCVVSADSEPSAGGAPSGTVTAGLAAGASAASTNWIAAVTSDVSADSAGAISSAALLCSVTPSAAIFSTGSAFAGLRSATPLSPERGSGARATAAPVPVEPAAAVLTLAVLVGGSEIASLALPCGISAGASVLADSTVAVGRFRSCSGDIGERPPYGFVPCCREFGLGYSTRRGLEQRRG